MEVVSKEIAQAEVDKWLDFKRIRPSKRESNKEYIDALVAGICDGLLILKDDMRFEQNLQFPIEDKTGGSSFKTLEYKPRINVSLIQLHLQGVKTGDADGRLLAHVTALTAKPKELIKKLDTEDYGIALAIAVFFV